MIDKKDNSIIRGFPSMADAARYLIDNQLTNCKMTTIRYHISEVCNGKERPLLGTNGHFSKIFRLWRNCPPIVMGPRPEDGY